MTPLQIEILMHYYTRPGDYREGDFSAPAVRETMEYFEDINLLKKIPISSDTSDENLYKLDDRGKVYLEALMRVPLPVWGMPK